MKRLLLVCAFLSVTCARPDRGVEKPFTTTGSAPLPLRSSARRTDDPPGLAGRCVWPLPREVPAPAPQASHCPSDPAPAPPRLPRGQVRFVDAPGRPEIEVEVATTPEEQSRGLMFRNELGPEQGMLFWGTRETVRQFWMHNTCLALDMLFIAQDGLIVGILEQVPPLNDQTRSVPCPSAHVLEVKAGWSRAHGVQPGQRVAIDPGEARI